MTTSSNIMGILVAYISSLIIPYHIALSTLRLKKSIPKREDLTSEERYKARNFPYILIINQYLDEREKAITKERYYFILLNIWRFLLSVVYSIVLIGMFNWTIVLWTMQLWLASIITACVTVLTLWHFISSWRFGHKLF